MAIAYIQTPAATVGAGGVNTYQVIFASNVTGGNTIIVCSVNSGSVVTAITSVTDSRGNTYVARGPGFVNGHNTVEIWSTVNSGTGPCTVTVTYADNCEASITVSEFSGVASSSVVDVTGGVNGSAGDATTSLITTNADDVLIGTMTHTSEQTTMTPGTNFTVLAEVEDVTHMPIHSCYRIVSSTGTYPVTIALGASVFWKLYAVALKAAAVGANYVVTLSETSTLSDAAPHGAEKTLLDSPTLVDDMMRASGKRTSESVSLAESFLSQLIHLKLISETLTVSEVIPRSIKHNLSDSLFLADDFTRSGGVEEGFVVVGGMLTPIGPPTFVVFCDEPIIFVDVISKRTMHEIVFISVYLDFGFASVGKILSDTLSLADVTNRGTTKVQPITDVFGWGEVFTKVFAKAVPADQITTNEVLTKAPKKILTESIPLSEFINQTIPVSSLITYPIRATAQAGIKIGTKDKTRTPLGG